MNPSETDDNPTKKPRIDRRKISALWLLAEALFQAETLGGPEASTAAGLAIVPGATPPAEPATLVAH